MNDGKNLILVVDDNPENLKVLGQIVRKKGHNLTFAQDGEGALLSIKSKKPDLILLDIMMPNMDGYEVCKRLKENVDTKDIPIIFLTARAEQEDIIKGLELGAMDYVTKPFNARELLVRVGTHLDLKNARDTIAHQKKDLEIANAAKDKFFSIIAHDLGNLFNGLLSFSDILTNKTIALSEREKEEFLGIIQESSQQGFALLRNLLEWSRVQTGRIHFQPEYQNLKGVVDANIVLLRGNIKAKNINMLSDISPSLEVFADSNMFNTVIRNILSNAVKFTPEEGKITVSARKNGKFAKISVTDTGIGIADSELPKLFKIDVNYTTLGTNKEKGTGLGLILCKEFVEKNGGEIWVESEEGKGSTFYLTLPARDLPDQD
jgi:two-component system sensor histidine kinase/response regulator